MGIILSYRYELSQAQVEQGKLLLQEDVLKEKEMQLTREKKQVSNIRNKKEQDYADQALKRKRAQQRYDGLQPVVHL